MIAKNEREYVRRLTSMSVEFSVDGGRVYMGLIEDKSDKGVFIETTEHFSKGQYIFMTIESPRPEGEERTGRIVRVTPHGIGVKFNYPGYTR